MIGGRPYGMRDGHDFMRFSRSTITPFVAGPDGGTATAAILRDALQLFNLFADALAGAPHAPLCPIRSSARMT